MEVIHQPCQNALEKQVRIANSLRDTLSVLNSSLELGEVLDFIVNQAKEILEADAAAIYSIKDKEGLLKIESSNGLTEDYIGSASIPKGIGATGLASVLGKPVAIENINHFEDHKEIVLDEERRILVKKLGTYFRALLALPLIFPSGIIYGTLDLYFKEPRNFIEEEISLANAYANQTILAIENTNLRTRAKQSATLAERERLARELHDTVTQTLFSMSLISGVLPTLWKNDPTVGENALEEIKELNRGALAEMRTLLFELRPSALLSVDLTTLIQQLVDAFSSHTRIPVNYMYQPINCVIPVDLKIAFYRIVQETLRNIEKHGHANNVKIALETFNNDRIIEIDSNDCKSKAMNISIVIEDDGVGFYPGNISGENFGLRIMFERAREIGATINIFSQPGSGTRVELNW